jgi:putative ATP-binding cassette transporter
MKIVSFLLRSSPALVVAAILTGLLAGVSNTGLLIVINGALYRRDAASEKLIWIYVALCAVLLISRSVSSILLVHLSRWAIYHLRMKLFHRIITTPLRHLEELGMSRLLAVLTEDVPAISLALVNVPVICIHLTVLITCLIYMYWLSAAVFLSVSSFMTVGIFSYYFFFRRAQRYQKLSLQQWPPFLNHMRGLINGAKELKLNRKRRAAFFSEHIEPTANAIRRYGYLGDRTFAIAATWEQLIIFTLIGLLLFNPPFLSSIDARTLIGYTLIILYMMTPIDTIMNLLPIMGRADVAMKKVESLGFSLSGEEDEPASDAHTASACEFQSLELIGATYTYYHEELESDFQLGPINLSFSPGEIIFLVGGNGSGKTTFAKLLVGLYRPGTGEVRLNGQTIRDEDRDRYQQLFSSVFSDFFLFESLLGLESPGLDEKARQFLTRFQLAHKVQVQGGAFSTTELSQGQRKRLAMIIAYLEDRPFYVFDEWAADQEPFFREIFYLHLLPELKARGKAVLVISHDDRYFHVADHLIKLDYGKLVYDDAR